VVESGGMGLDALRRGDEKDGENGYERARGWKE